MDVATVGQKVIFFFFSFALPLYVHVESLGFSLKEKASLFLPLSQTRRDKVCQYLINLLLYIWSTLFLLVKASKAIN